jgi:hypothetical protein
MIISYILLDILNLLIEEELILLSEVIKVYLIG